MDNNFEWEDGVADALDARADAWEEEQATMRDLLLEEQMERGVEPEEEDYGDYEDEDEDEEYEEDDCPLDGDATSALASAGYGTDEDYGFYGD